MKASKLAGTHLQQQKIQDLRAQLEWARQLGVILALLPYSGDRTRYRPPAPRVPDVVIPFQRKPSPAEQRVARAAPLLERHVQRRSDITNNRGGRG